LRVDQAETGCTGARHGVDGLFGGGVYGSRYRDIGPVENVGELDAEAEAIALFVRELAAKTEILHGVARVAVIAVVGGGGAEPARGRIGPRGRVEHECFIGVEAMTVEVLGEQRPPRDAIRIRGYYLLKDLTGMKLQEVYFIRVKDVKKIPDGEKAM
jgi:hypothetical protein